MKNLRAVAAASVAALLAGCLVAWAAQTNYLGTVFIADKTTPTQQLTVNADGSINANVTGGSGGTVTANQGTAGASPWPMNVLPGSGSTLATAYGATTALASNKVLKASAGNLYGFQVSADSTLSAAAWWVMVYDATSLPGDGAVTPAKCYAMPAGASAMAASFASPARFATGITVGVSTNGCFTQAASIHAFISGEAQ